MVRLRTKGVIKMKNYQMANNLQAFNLTLIKLIMSRYKNLGIDITPVQGRIIMIIYESKQEVCQTDIKEYIACNKSTLSSVLDTMEKNGLIVRQESSSDSRKKIIVLTDLSKELVEKVKKDKAFVEAKLFEGISKEEYVFFNNILEKMRNNLERVK